MGSERVVAAYPSVTPFRTISVILVIHVWPRQARPLALVQEWLSRRGEMRFGLQRRRYGSIRFAGSRRIATRFWYCVSDDCRLLVLLLGSTLVLIATFSHEPPSLRFPAVRCSPLLKIYPVKVVPQVFSSRSPPLSSLP